MRRRRRLLLDIRQVYPSVGAFHKVIKRHFHLHVAEFQFRYNNRDNADVFRTANGGCLMSSRRHGKKQKRHTGGSTQDEQKSQRGSSDAIPAENNLIEAEGHRCKPCKKTENSEHIENERNLVRLTGALVVVGAITFLVLIVHGFIFWRTDETARNADRAYVFSSELTTEVVRDKDQKIVGWRLSPIVENGGNTSAINGTIEEKLNFTVVPQPTNDHLEPTGDLSFDGKEVRHFTLGPKVKSDKILAAIQSSPSHAAALRAGQTFFILGEIKYDDVFQLGRVARFCYALASRPDRVGFEDELTYALCSGRFACADEQCKKR